MTYDVDFCIRFCLAVFAGYACIYSIQWLSRRVVGYNEFTKIRIDLMRFVENSQRIKSLFPPSYIHPVEGIVIPSFPNSRRSSVESIRSSSRPTKSSWLQFTEEGLAEVKLGLTSRIGTAAEKSPQFAEALKYTLVKSGKMVRSRLIILLARALNLDDSEKWNQIINLSQVVELEHAASLLHDDVVDDADTRRGVAAHRRVFGDRAAVLTGDSLISILVEALTEIGNMEITESVSHSIEALVIGELLQLIAKPMDSETYGDGLFPESLFSEQKISQDDLGRIHLYIRKSYFKTASLFACATSCVGRVAGSPKQQVFDLAAFGFYFGVAFQLIDDVLDLDLDNVDTVEVGKPVGGSDIRNGTVTIPVLLACIDDKALIESERSELRRMVRRRFGLGGDCERTIELLVKSNGVSESRRLISYYLELARYHLNQIQPLGDREIIEGLLRDYQFRKA